MLTRKAILTMTVAAGFAAAPVLAFGQATSGGSSMQPQATQTTPQQGQVSGTPAARDATTGGSAPGQATTSQSTPVPGPTTAQAPTGGNTSAPRDGTPGNPPSTATQRAVDSVTGNRTPADGTPGNPPGTAAGRAIDRTLGTNTTGANPSGAAANGTTTQTTTTTTAVTAMPTTGPLAVDAARLHEGRRASKVIGSTVYGGDGNDSIGSVDDLIVPRDGGNLVAILSVGGFLGIGAKLVAVPYERLQYNAERDRWMLPGATKEALTALPTFAYDTTRRETSTTGSSAGQPAQGGAAGGGATTATTPARPAAPAR